MTSDFSRGLEASKERMMKTKYWRWVAIHWFGVLTFAFAITACAATQGIVMHSFGFDAIQDSPDIEVLDYRYGNSKQPGARPPAWALRENRVSQGTSTHGEMLRGDELYVKWRIKSSGSVHEDIVDLRRRLPENIKDHRVYFIVKDTQLYVYLVTPERRSPDTPPNGPPQTQYLKTITIYPDQPKQ